MEAKTDIINIITYKLPYKLVRPIFNEFHNRLSEVQWLVKNSEYYAPLKEYIESVEVLLALTIFHKRFLANLDGALKFHNKVSSIGLTDTIKIGSYEFNKKESNKILAIDIQYRQLKEKFHIPDDIVDYTETKQFLSRVKSILENENKFGETG